MDEIIINESFADDNVDMLFDKVEKNDFSSQEMLSLKVSAEEINKKNEINELISWDVVKKNLEYHFAYQKEGALKILKDFNCTALLADEVGLGKTITTGIVLKECIMRGFTKKILILTPPSLVDQWVAELKEKFELDFTIIESDKDWKNTNFAIASIDRVKAYNREIGEFRHKDAHDIQWDLLVVDEAHKLKSRTTTRWRFVDKIKKKRFLILTATPFQNDLLELYNLLHILKRGHLGTVQEFRKNFLNRGNKRYPLNPYELKRKLNQLMVRRKRSETKINYTKRIPKVVPVDLTKPEMEVYEEMCDLIKKQYFSASGNEINGKLAVYAILPKITSSIASAKESLTNMINNEKYHEKTKDRAQRILNAYNNLKTDSKINKLLDIVQDNFTNIPDSKMLIYTKHPTTLRYIAEQLRPLGLKVIEFVGGLDREEKTKRILEFKNSAEIMISTETGCEGLNFQFCNSLINYDLPWNPMSVEQRIGRLDRIGQKRDMNIYSLATKGTMEEHVVDLIINKMCCVGLVIGELPIILFNLGLDGYSEKGVNKIEERLMNSFIDSKNNLEMFSSEVDKIAELIDEGIEAYREENNYNQELLDEI
ncbi:DEAD/DEAH box helicase family protein [archaeon]|jgi:SNF2 family DNA or RNA helicase|nr:DEAD/DEAH box helicase family protein [archaeon]